MGSNSRNAILQAHGLLYAPRPRQEEFWQRYNVERRRRWRMATIGDVAGTLLREDSPKLGKAFLQVTKAWEAVVPREYVARSRLDGFTRGTLSVTVDSAATRYVLGRQRVRSILADLNGNLHNEGANAWITVRWIEYRVGSLREDNNL